MSKQGHYTFVNQEYAEEFAKIFKGKSVPDYSYSINPVYHVWFEYDDKESLIERLLESNCLLRETCDRITKRNNELRGKVLRLINNNEELKKSIEIQVDNNITMEHQLDRIKEIVQED